MVIVKNNHESSKIDFKGGAIFESAAWVFVIILKFIFTSILEIKIHKKIPWHQKKSFSKADFYKAIIYKAADKNIISSLKKSLKDTQICEITCTFYSAHLNHFLIFHSLISYVIRAEYWAVPGDSRLLGLIKVPLY